MLFTFIFYPQIINNSVCLTKEFGLAAPFCRVVDWEEKMIVLAIKSLLPDGHLAKNI